MRIIIILLSLFIAITAIISGLAMIIFPDGSLLMLSKNILADTPFRDFAIPGLLLAIVVGGSNLAGFSYTAARHRNAHNWSLFGGITIMAWIVTQSILVSSFYWLQWLYFGCGLVLFLTSFQLKGKWLA